MCSANYKVRIDTFISENKIWCTHMWAVSTHAHAHTFVRALFLSDFIHWDIDTPTNSKCSQHFRKNNTSIRWIFPSTYTYSHTPQERGKTLIFISLCILHTINLFKIAWNTHIWFLYKFFVGWPLRWFI